MPRLNISHDKLVRIASALAADTVRRAAISPSHQINLTNAAIEEENTAIIGAINRARAKDGLLPLPTGKRT